VMCTHYDVIFFRLIMNEATAKKKRWAAVKWLASLSLPCGVECSTFS
jgi:hypothetical protein